MHLVGITGMDLMVSDCLCGEYAILGFPGQIDWKHENGKAVADLPCRNCGRVHRREYSVALDDDEYQDGGGI